MWLRQSILQKHLKDRKIYRIIWHHWLKYVNSILKNLFLLLLLYFSYTYLVLLFESFYLDLFFAVLWLLVYFVFMISVMDIYLDSIAITDKWIVLFRRNGLLRQNTEHIQWESAQSVYDEQIWIMDIIFWKWNIKIKRQDEIYLFDNISSPSAVTNYIVQIRDSINSQEDENEDVDKFDVLVETLWEVILDYVKNNKKTI